MAADVALTLPIVEELLHRGHRVSYLTTDPSSGHVTATEVGAVTYPSPASVPTAGRTPRAAVRPGPFPLPAIARAVSVGPADRHFADGRPDLLLYDDAMADRAAPLARRWARPAVRVFRSFADADRAAAEVPALSLALLPRAFQPAADRFDDRYAFVGPCLSSRAHEDTWYPPVPDRPVLLVTPGQVPDRRHEVFLRTCLAAYASQPWHVVISTAGHADLSWLGPLPRHVQVHFHGYSAPAALPHADALVAPAGMATAMESLYFGTPLLSVPEDPEQAAVADRVTELGLGHRIDAYRISASALREVTAHVMTDHAVRTRVTRMRVLARAAGGTVGAVNRIERCLGGGSRGLASDRRRHARSRAKVAVLRTVHRGACAARQIPSVSPRMTRSS